MTAPNPDVTSPWVQKFSDYIGKIIRISVTFNSPTRALTGATAFRDADCVYTKIYIGLGADGTPDSTADVFPVPAGTTNITAQQLRRNQLRTVEDVLALQITAGP